MLRHQTLYSLDQTTFSDCQIAEPSSYNHLFDIINKTKKIVPYGSGVSYVGASFDSNSISVSTKFFNRILNFDSEQKIIEAEGGTNLGKLYDFLAPKGFYISVQPGHPQLTLAGLIAANAHGKNQYNEGTFRDIVRSFELYHPKRGQISVSRDNNPNLFDLTFGGYGLTGIILSVTLKVTDIPTHYIFKKNIKTNSFQDAIEKLYALKHEYDFLQSWHDTTDVTASQKGFITCGKFQNQTSDNNICLNSEYKLLTPHKRYFRPAIFNPITMSTINQIFYAMEMRKEKGRQSNLFSYLFPVANKKFYFDFYGSKGFIEHQVLIPKANALNYLDEWVKLVKDHGLCIPRTSMKLFSGEQKYLWYCGTGVSLSCDFFYSKPSLAFLKEVDQLDIKYKAICNIIKDSRLPQETVKKMYPNYQLFKEKLLEWDPDRVFCSLLSKRLKI